MKQKLILIIILTIGLFSFLWGQNNLKQIDISEDDYLVDLQFTITKHWQDDQKNHCFRVNGLMGSNSVGFDVSFRPDMQIGVVDGKVDQSRFYAEGITLYSIGEQSNNFIIGLIDLYKVDCKLKTMKDTITTTTFILSGNPENINTEKVADVQHLGGIGHLFHLSKTRLTNINN